MKRRLVWMLVLIGSASATVAEAQRWTLRTTYIESRVEGEGRATFEASVRTPGARRDLELEGGLRLGDGDGVGLLAEVAFADRWGLEFGAIRTSQESEIEVRLGGFEGGDRIDVGMLPVVAGLNFHLLPRRSTVDLFVGAYAAWVGYGEGSLRIDDVTYDVEFDDDFGWGLNLGLDVHLGQVFLVALGVRYLESSSELRLGIPDGVSGTSSPSDPLEADLILYSVGFGVRF